MKRRFVLSIICCLVLTAISLHAQIRDANPSPKHGLVEYPSPFPARDGDVDWGLALSGGGLRSAAFSIGAMKALYDVGLMDDVDVISSVSGGGYASYWLFSRFDPSGNENFGSAAFDNANFPTQVCKLANRSRFFPFRQMMAAIVSPRGIAFRSYRRAIQRSFGTDTTRDRPLDGLKDRIHDGYAPYFIFNTTLKSLKAPDGKKADKIDKSFEIAPTYRGNRTLGYADWPSGKSDIESMADGVAVSGAAVRFKLSRKIEGLDGKKKLDIADGGLSENLAALPLIMRGLKNIVIVDAENDPGYKFESYCGLRSYLRASDVDFSVDEIDRFYDCDSKRHRSRKDIFTAAAVATGHAKSRADYDGPPIDSRIFYIKMSRPDSIFSETALRSSGIDLENLEYTGKTRPDDCPPEKLPPITRRTMLRDVLAYASYLNSDWRWGKFIAFLPYINYNFPQITTVDQTFYSDQLEAFVGLGYLETIEIADAETLAEAGTK